MVVAKRRVAEAAQTSNKKLKPVKRVYDHIFVDGEACAKALASPAAALPARRHALVYHRPELLDHGRGISLLLRWFDTVSTKREMPWRQAWIDPSSSSAQSVEEALKKRAYQVWISEIMLQQTRVETVKTFFINWMSKWPTIEELASAPSEEVLAAWRGLGYYSRATRIHQAAQKIVQDPDRKGMMPQMPEELQKEVPGVGPYTAGAISSIVFGHAVPILDGNVARVLSRQLALYANPKAKLTNDILWAAAEALVKRAANVSGEAKRSAIPGQWNQALMELGSTVCTPTKPDCAECPLSDTCMARREALAPSGVDSIQDIEDLCTICEPMAFADDDHVILDKKKPQQLQAKSVTKKLRQATLQGFGNIKAIPVPENATPATERLESHIKRFPMKLEKQKVRREQCLVLVIHRKLLPGEQDAYWIQQRPSSGLLASMWQFPALTMSTTDSGDDGETQECFASDAVPNVIREYVDKVFGLQLAKDHASKSLGSITHLFSHLHLTMHVHMVTLSDPPIDSLSSTASSELKNKDFGSSLESIGGNSAQKWATTTEVEAENMGTGMRNVWTVVQQHS